MGIKTDHADRDEMSVKSVSDFSRFTVLQMKDRVKNRYCDFDAHFVAALSCPVCAAHAIYCCETSTDHDAFNTWGFYIHTCAACGYESPRSEEWCERVGGTSDGPFSCPFLHA